MYATCIISFCLCRCRNVTVLSFLALRAALVLDNSESEQLYKVSSVVKMSSLPEEDIGVYKICMPAKDVDCCPTG